MKQRQHWVWNFWQQRIDRFGIERFANLRWRLTALLAVILLCTLIVIGSGVVLFVRQTEMEAWRGRQEEATHNTVRAVMNLLENTRNSLNFINLLGLDDFARNKTLLDKLLLQYPILQEIIYFNAQGERVAATTSAAFLAQDRAIIVQEPWFIAAQAGQPYSYSSLSLATEQYPYLVSAIPAPNASVIAARVDMSALWALVAEMRTGQSGRTYLVERSGKIIAHTDHTMVLEGRMVPNPLDWFTALTTQDLWHGGYVNFQNERVVGTVDLVPGVDWLVVTELSRAEAFATSRRAYWMLGGGILGFMVLLMWVSAEWIEGLILAPVERLRDGAERIGQGDLAHRIEFVRSDEIGQVAAAFNHMATELEELYGSLEQKIADRTVQLEAQTTELERSNAELAQFAYIASHDLQEPLRMINSYLRLIERRYKGQLDKEADEFIGFALDGSVRMQQLIRDLLAYSRVGTRNQPLEPTDCQLIFRQVLVNLQMAIQESGTVVTADALPTLFVDPTYMAQLLQNLIANAIKFRSAHTPQIQIHASYRPQPQEWLFGVTDNGIGIAPDSFERIFLIFQRLHTRSEYPGTGIGLAICKKIIDRHGGRIWVESTLGQGTTFYFTLPDRR